MTVRADEVIADPAAADVPLAARCVEAGARVIGHDGSAFTPGNIGDRLSMRDLMADLRAADPFRQGGNKGFRPADRARFLEALERELHRKDKALAEAAALLVLAKKYRGLVIPGEDE